MIFGRLLLRPYVLAKVNKTEDAQEQLRDPQDMFMWDESSFIIPDFK